MTHDRISVTINGITTNHRVPTHSEYGTELTRNDQFDIAISRSVRQRWGRNFYWERDYGSIGEECGRGIIAQPIPGSRFGANVLMQTCPDVRYI